MAMMKKALFLFFCFLLSLQTTFSQNPPVDERQRLMQQISTLYGQAKFDEAISLAEKLLKIERKTGSMENVSTAVLNLAILRKERFQFNRRKIGSPQIPVREKIELSEKAEKDADEAEKLFREFLETKRGDTKAEMLQTATAQNELAEIIINNLDLPDNVKAPQARTSLARKRIDEAESFFTQALDTREKLLGASDEATLATVANFADFYRQYVNFEKALPFYERFLAAKDKVKNSTNLVSALRSYASILITTDQEGKAREIVKQIESVSGKIEPLPAADVNLSLRITRTELARLQQMENKGELIERLSKEHKKRLKVNVVIDETGKIVEAVANFDDEKWKSQFEQSIRQITFRPFVYKGTAQKMRGWVFYAQLPFK
jgi:tetratricopeptide (TPR) repeat protein